MTHTTLVILDWAASADIDDLVQDLCVIIADAVLP